MISSVVKIDSEDLKLCEHRNPHTTGHCQGLMPWSSVYDDGDGDHDDDDDDDDNGDEKYFMF